jgi:hypothetical protein
MSILYYDSPWIFCINPITPDIPNFDNYDQSEIQTIRFSSFDSESVTWDRVLFNLHYRDKSTEIFNANMSVEEIIKSVTPIMNEKKIAVSRYETNRIQMTYELTFSRIVGELIEVVLLNETNGNDVVVQVFQDLHPTCSVYVSLNGVDFFGGDDPSYIFDDRILISTVAPQHGSFRGGHQYL